MIIYLLNMMITIFWASLIYNSKVKNKDILFLSPILLMLVFIAAFRSSNVGVDTVGYLKHYNMINSQNLSIWGHQMEPLYVLLNKIGCFISSNKQSILFLSALITNLLIFLRVYEASPYPWLSIYLYLSLFMYYNSFNGIRSAIAVSILFYTSKFIEEEKLFKFLLGILVAMGFHVTAIIFLPFYFSKKIINNRRSFLLFISVIIVIILNIENIFEILTRYYPTYSVYTLSFFSASGGIRDIVISSLILLFGQFVTKIYGTNKKIKLLEFYVILYLIFSILALIGNPSIVLRIGWYFSIYLILYIPEIIKAIKKPEIKIIALYLIIVLTFILYLYLLSVNYHTIIPYNFFIFE